MDIKRYLAEEIKKCKRKINFARFVDWGILSAAAGGIFGMFCELASLFVQFYYVHLAAGFCFAAGFLAGACLAVYKWADMKQAARRLDSFGLEERMLTACELMDKDNNSENEFIRMQREDAYTHYNQMRGQIKIPLLPDKRHILALALSVAVVIGMGLMPSPVRNQAQVHHQVQEQVKEEKKKLESLVDALEGVDMESLAEEQKELLQELLQAMELSQEELERASSWDSMNTAMEKLDYKYQQAAQSLSNLSSQLGNPETANIATAEKLAKALANQSGQQMAFSGAQDGNGSNNGNGDGNGNGGNENGNGGEDGDENGGGDGSEDGNSGGDGSEGGNGDGNGDGSGGINGDGNDGGDMNGNGNSGKDGNGSGNGNGDGNGNGNGDGSGNGNGDGNGDGNGNGNGGGNGNGSGDGNGSGRGTGSSSASHDYVSIPNAVSDDSSLTGNKNGDQDSDYFRQQNGLAWEGMHVDYDSVIGQYTDNAYEGIANGRYPSGMESVIRDYFGNLNKK